MIIDSNNRIYYYVTAIRYLGVCVVWLLPATFALRLYSGSIQALSRLYSGSIQALFRLYSGSIKVRYISQPLTHTRLYCCTFKAPWRLCDSIKVLIKALIKALWRLCDTSLCLVSIRYATYACSSHTLQLRCPRKEREKEKVEEGDGQREEGGRDRAI